MEKQITSFETEFAGEKLIIETGKMARLANGSVTVRYGDTVVLATAVIASEPREGVDFFPLMVEYEERLYAAGKISGSRFIKRETRPSENAVLTARLIDRPLRPLFPKHYRNDVQVIVTVLSYDKERTPDIISVIAASSALMLTHAPFEGPIGAVRIGLIDGQFVLNPTVSQIEQSELDLVVAGTEAKVLMLEAGAKIVSDEKMVDAIAFAQKNIAPVIAIQNELSASIERAGLLEPEEEPIIVEVSTYLGSKLKEVIREADKTKREEQLLAFEREVLENFEGNFKQIDLKEAFSKIVEKEVRELVLHEGKRVDGRAMDEIRPINIEVGLLPRVHGSGLFTRGQTQALTIATLGSPSEGQMIDTMEEDANKRYMHHYNFPPYSTGEVKPLRGASRREIGHGALAERALVPVIPSEEEFPYTIRLVTEVLSSNGSSSMAATCGSTIALMDAGVPIKAPVAGVAIGLITNKHDPNKYQILTDIQGIEDFGGDMDFKVTGTTQGITAIQMDTKTKGLTMAIIRDAIEAASRGRAFILNKMLDTISEPRKELSEYAPRITSLKINPNKIGTLIGPGGKTIKKIVETSGGQDVISIDIEEDGTVLITSLDAKATEIALNQINDLTREFKIGELVSGKIVNIQKDRISGKEIGAIVQLASTQDGMIHISQVANERIDKVSDRLKVGDEVTVKIIDIDSEKGRISLSLKDAQNQTV